MATPASSPPRRTGLLRNISWLTGGSLLVKPLWFVFITAFCMRILGPAGYGVITATLALMRISAFFSDLGTSQYTVREVARREDEASAFFSNLLMARGVLAVFALGGALVIGLILGYEPGELIALVFAGVYALGLRPMEFCRSFYRAFEVLRYEALSLIIEKILVITAGVALLWTTRTPVGTLSGMAMGMALALLVNVGWIHYRITPFRRRLFDGGFIKKAFRIAWPLGLYGLFSAIILMLGAVLLEALDGETAAGQYGAAFRLVEALLLLPAVVVAAILPRLSTLFHKHDIDGFGHILRRSLLGTGALTLGAALVLTFAGPAVMHLLDPSPAFAATGVLLQFLIWAYPLLTANHVVAVALIASDEQRFLALALGVGAVLMLVLNLLLIPAFTYYGTAAALMIGTLVVLVACSWRCRTVLRRARRHPRYEEQPAA